MFSSFNRRHGRIRIWDVLGVFAVLGVVFLGFVIPAINSARRAAYPNRCRNKIRYLAIATIEYEEAKRGFPALYFRNVTGSTTTNSIGTEVDPSVSEPHYSWIVRVLPYIEEKRIFDQIELNSKEFSLDPREVQVLIPSGKQLKASECNPSGLLCPSSSNDLQKFSSNTSFVALTATKQQLITVGEGKATLADGIIIPSASVKGYKGISSAAIRDGVSKTLMLAETNEDERSNWYHWQQTFVCGFLPGDTSVPDHDPGKGIPRVNLSAEKDKQWIFNQKAGNRTALMFGSPTEHRRSPYNSDQNDPLRRTLGPSSEHGNNTVLHANADGSIREIDVNSIDPQVYYAGITRTGAIWIAPDE